MSSRLQQHIDKPRRFANTSSVASTPSYLKHKVAGQTPNLDNELAKLPPPVNHYYRRLKLMRLILRLILTAGILATIVFCIIF